MKTARDLENSIPEMLNSVLLLKRMTNQFETLDREERRQISFRSMEQPSASSWFMGL